MKNLKTISALVLILLSTVILINCENENLEPNDINLVSPKGFKIADNISQLKLTLGLDQNQEITNVKFIESNDFNVAFIDYKGINGVNLNVVIAKGNVNFNSNELIINKLPNKNQFNTGTWTISCGGCADCRVSGTIDSEGNITFQCESSCCVMRVEKE